MTPERLTLPIYEHQIDRGAKSLLPVPAKYDFARPGWYNWKGPSRSLKRYLKEYRIYPLPEERIVFHLSGLDKLGTNPDPLRAEYNPLGENFSDEEMATGYLGLQALWWQYAYEGVKYNFIRPSRAKALKMTPVFSHQEKYYLLVDDYGFGPGVTGSNFGGDADAISDAENYQVKAGKKYVEGSRLGLKPRFFDRYVALREELNQIESNCQQKALTEVAQTDGFQNLGRYLTFNDRLAEAVPQGRYYQSLLTVREVLAEMEPNPNLSTLAFFAHLELAIYDLLIIELDQLYDDHLAESNYEKTLGKISGLLIRNHKVALKSLR